MHHKRKKHASVVLDFLKAIRRRYRKAKRIYLVMDNLSTHKTPDILQWCRRHQVSPVFTATNASWMNRVECHLTAAHYFVIKNSDPDDHRAVGLRMQEYLRWRNRNTDDAKLAKAQNSMPTL
jgi:transposase